METIDTTTKLFLLLHTFEKGGVEAQWNCPKTSVSNCRTVEEFFLSITADCWSDIIIKRVSRGHVRHLSAYGTHWFVSLITLAAVLVTFKHSHYVLPVIELGGQARLLDGSPVTIGFHGKLKAIGSRIPDPEGTFVVGILYSVKPAHKRRGTK